MSIKMGRKGWEYLIKQVEVIIKGNTNGKQFNVAISWWNIICNCSEYQEIHKPDICSMVTSYTWFPNLETTFIYFVFLKLFPRAQDPT